MVEWIQNWKVFCFATMQQCSISQKSLYFINRMVIAPKNNGTEKNLCIS